MYSSGLVPRRMAWLGLIGGPLLLIGNVGVLFDWWDQSGAVTLLVVPEFVWEAFLGIYCAIWGVPAGFSDPRPERPLTTRRSRAPSRGIVAGARRRRP